MSCINIKKTIENLVTIYDCTIGISEWIKIGCKSSDKEYAINRVNKEYDSIMKNRKINLENK